MAETKKPSKKEIVSRAIIVALVISEIVAIAFTYQPASETIDTYFMSRKNRDIATGYSCWLGSLEEDRELYETISSYMTPHASAFMLLYEEYHPHIFPILVWPSIRQKKLTACAYMRGDVLFDSPTYFRIETALCLMDGEWYIVNMRSRGIFDDRDI